MPGTNSLAYYGHSLITAVNLKKWRQDTQHNDTQKNTTQHNEAQHYISPISLFVTLNIIGHIA